MRCTKNRKRVLLSSFHKTNLWLNITPDNTERGIQIIPRSRGIKKKKQKYFDQKVLNTFHFLWTLLSLLCSCLKVSGEKWMGGGHGFLLYDGLETHSSHNFLRNELNRQMPMTWHNCFVWKKIITGYFNGYNAFL